MKTLAMIMAGGRGTRLSVLSQKRVKPAVPFAGKYRIVDFTLSNCANSGIFDVGILTQYRPHSLNNHIRTGRPWDLDRTLSGAVTLLPPYERNDGSLDWYHGTADAVYRNLDFIRYHKCDTVLVLSGDHVYKMDYNPLLRFHQEHQADVTICTVDVPPDAASRFGVVVTDDNGRVVEFQEKPRKPQGTLASMGIYVFQLNVLVQRLVEDAQQTDSSHDFGKDVLPRMLELGDRLYAYPSKGYWVDVGTVEAYWEANMDFLSPAPPFDLSAPGWEIHTRCEERRPVKVCLGAAVSDSLLSDGCVIGGRVEHTVLSPGVRVEADTVIRDSIIFSDSVIGAGARIQRAILDKNVIVGEGARIGFDINTIPNRTRSDASNHGITLIGKNTHLPAGLRVGHSCFIGSDLIEDDFVTNIIVSGQCIGYPLAGGSFEAASAAPVQQNESRIHRTNHPHQAEDTDSRAKPGYVKRKQGTIIRATVP